MNFFSPVNLVWMNKLLLCFIKAIWRVGLDSGDTPHSDMFSFCILETNES